MSTHALIKVLDGVADGTKKNMLLSLYIHMDGYPSGVGSDLAGFLAPKRLVNGIGMDSTHTANGMGDLAAQLVHYFKGYHPVGNVYVYPSTTALGSEEWTYVVKGDTFDPGKGFTVAVYEYGKKVAGPFREMAEFAEWCASYE